MPSAKDVAALTAAIAGVIPGGQPVAGAAAALAGFLPGSNDAEKKKIADWAVRHIPEWKDYCRSMTTLNFPDQTKAAKLQDTIESDWFEAFGSKPKKKWVEQLSEQTYDAVLEDMSRKAIEKAAAAKKENG